MRYIILLVLMTSTGWAQDAVFNPDLSLIMEAGANNLNKESPYLVRYAKDDRQLSFVAARHGKQSENAATFALVKSEFDALVPDMVIIEGVYTVCMACPPNCSAAFGASLQGAFEKKECGERVNRMAAERLNTEAYYAASLAYNHEPRIPFIGGEILNSDLKAHILKKFTVRQFANYYVMRALGASVNGGADCKPDMVRKIAAESLQKFNLEFSENRRLKAADLSYFQGACKESPSANQPNVAGTFTQKISAASAAVRDQHLVQVIANMLKGHKKVLVVYGGGHYDTNYKVLDAMLGAPAFP